MTYADKTIICSDCGVEFVHSAADQQRYAERGFTNEPKRCSNCRAKRKTSSGARRATCADPPTEGPAAAVPAGPGAAQRGLRGVRAPDGSALQAD